MDKATPTLPPDLFESLVMALADALIRDYRDRWSRRGSEPLPPPPPASDRAPWLTVAEAAQRSQCARAKIYSEVRSGRLRAARVAGGRVLRIRPEWVDEWLESASASEQGR